MPWGARCSMTATAAVGCLARGLDRGEAAEEPERLALVRVARAIGLTAVPAEVLIGAPFV